MNSDPRRASEPVNDDDPVARFFAQQRDSVESQPATDLDWQRILRSARTTTRRRSHVTIIASAAVAIVALFAIWSWQQPTKQTGVDTTVPAATGQPRLGSGPATAPNSTATQQPFAVPKSFTTWSVSYAAQNTLYALGAQTCSSDGTCPVLLRSGTDGQTWSAVHTFEGTDVSSATGQTVPSIQPSGAATQVRFATATTGYVFGGGLWVTHDGGASFTQMQHPGDIVLDVEIWQGQIMVLSASGCTQGVCSGPVYVSKISAQSNNDTDMVATTSPSSAISAGRIVVQNNQTYVELTSSGSAASPSAMRLVGGNLVPLTGPSSCASTPIQALTPATNISALVLYGLCDERVSGADATYTVVRSTDDGQTWTTVSTSALTLPNLGQVWLAAADEKHVVAATGGQPAGSASTATGSGNVLVSGDGGGSFAPAAVATPATGVNWLASPGSRIFYAFTRTNSQILVSDDYGQTWGVIDPTR
ncbi:sialidase family protein [Rudaeicoccus suwonensis]|uniref:BNR/Asp-box repeat protein n=1 Tax=Rudaeicoccus suwonensis TaxID=657409 RepID=A0A561EBJ4_9MICO|nr:hypothetical protein [Rudaeicoccus suwonensis]TWE12978.1 hypothetical protein BKA23_1806 [Rudaeicoccus suwonensis]